MVAIAFRTDATSDSAAEEEELPENNSICESPQNSNTCENSSVRIVPALHSGVDLRSKLLFGSATFSPSLCGFWVRGAKDVYILKFGARVSYIALGETLISLAVPFCSVFVGFLLDKHILSSCFPWAYWGRRAPYYLIHQSLLVVGGVGLLFPCTVHPEWICLWFFVWTSLGSWCIVVLYNVLDSCRVEIYPMKEERSEVESIIKLYTAVGIGIGLAPFLLLLADSSMSVRILSSVSMVLLGQISFVSVSKLRLARQEFDPSLLHTFYKEFLQMLRIPVCRHLAAYRFLEEFHNALLVNAVPFYFSLVDGIAGSELSIAMLLCALIVVCSQLAMIPSFTRFLSKRRPGVNINKVVAYVNCFHFLGAPLLYLWRDVFLLNGTTGFLVCAAVLSFASSGQTYWRFIVMGWIVDEDCQREKGRRREATIIGIILSAHLLARALAVVLLLNGLAATGMHVTNCDHQCENEGSACKEACDKNNFESQPPAVRAFLQSLFYGVSPGLMGLLVILVYTFPIYGARLDKIYEGQAKVFKPPS